MCGITGIISRSHVSPEQAALVMRMNALQTHRGPDGEGVFSTDHLHMAMRRLSIIDLSTGWQPLYNEDRSLALIANGEVYNFVELRSMLESRGHQFSTRSDCETILHLYEEHGDDCVHHLRGMYAFALWDSHRKRVLLVRDRMGEKPLYLVERDGEMIFSSELRTLVRAGVVGFELDPVAINEYFHFGYVLEPRSPIAGVRKLPAGHLITIEVDSWKIQQRCYWRMEDAPPIEGDPPLRIREELERISELIIRSDVPVGVALSGGLDSSIIAVLAQKNYPGTMQAITIGYEGSPWQDERAMARELAAHLNMPIHEVELTCDDLVESFPKMIVDRDEPIADMAGVGYWALMRRAHELNLPVMLAGQGGDELFWGYAWMREAVDASKRRQRLHGNEHTRHPTLRDYFAWRRPPLSYTGGLRWLRSFGGLRENLRQWREDRAGEIDRLVFFDRDTTFAEAMHSVANLYTPEFRRRVAHADPRSTFVMQPPWPNIDVTLMRMVSETYLRQNGLAQGDRLSMAWSVELRLPLVDYRLAEVVVGLTKTHESVAGDAKKWLREAVREVMPGFVMNRRKRGFSPPWRAWGRALSKTYAHHMRDGYLQSHGVLSEHGVEYARRWTDPRMFRAWRVLADRALLLECWCREMTATRQEDQTSVSAKRPISSVSGTPMTSTPVACAR